MRPLGFSTGALALGDARRAIEMLDGSGATAIELSALRLSELAPIVRILRSLDLTAYPYVSFHAPSRFDASEEAAVADAMSEIAALGWPVVLHPDTIHDFSPWRQLGRLLAIENMDKRKRTGRTTEELAAVFDELPDASFCFDIGHAHQVDRTMTEAHFVLKALGPRLVQLHVSEVTAESQHETLSRRAVLAFQKVARGVPQHAALILETPAGAAEVGAQLALAAEALGADPAETATITG